MADLYLCDEYDTCENKECTHREPHEHIFRCYLVPIVCSGAQCLEMQEPDTDYECNLDGHWADPAKNKEKILRKT